MAADAVVVDVARSDERDTLVRTRASSFAETSSSGAGTRADDGRWLVSGRALASAGVLALVAVVGAHHASRRGETRVGGLTDAFASLGDGAVPMLKPKERHPRFVGFEYVTRCIPDEHVERHAEFFQHEITGATLVTKCNNGHAGWFWEFNLRNPHTSYEMGKKLGPPGHWETRAYVDNTCEYGVVLHNAAGKRLWEIGGTNMDAPLETAPGDCSSRTRGGSNVYHNRGMWDSPQNNSVKWVWGTCRQECRKRCDVYALKDDLRSPTGNLLRQRERYAIHPDLAVGDRGRLHAVGSKNLRRISAGYEDIWAREDGNDVQQILNVHDMNETNSPWHDAWNLRERKDDVAVGRNSVYYKEGAGFKRVEGMLDGHGAWRDIKSKIAVWGREYFEAGDWFWSSLGDRHWACKLPCDENSQGIPKIPFVEGERGTPECHANNEWIFCLGPTTKKVYRTQVIVNAWDEVTGANYTWDNPPQNVWTLVPNATGYSIGVGKLAVWIVDDATREARYCPLPCASGDWRVPEAFAGERLMSIKPSLFEEQ